MIDTRNGIYFSGNKEIARKCFASIWRINVARLRIELLELSRINGCFVAVALES